MHLYLREFSTTDTTRKWAFTRPDRTTFFYDADGYPTGVEDNNGNRITYTLQDTPPGEDPGGPKKRITAVTDAAGNTATPAPNRKFNITYWSKADAKKAHIRGKIKRIADHTGSALDFVYYEDGNLLRLIQRGGTKADGSFLADRSWVFTYTTSNGEGPAIASAAARQNPEPKIGNQSTRVYSVIDPRGKETTFSYLGVGNGQDRWKLASRTNRASELTTYGYDSTARVTTITQPLSRVSKYTFDTEGKVTKLTNPLNEDVGLAWTADRAVSKVTEPHGQFTQYEYNENGYPTNQIDELGHTTQLDYENLAVDPGDVSGKWRTGRGIPHVSQLAAATTPRGVATTDANDFKTTFSYDVKGNLSDVKDPLAQPGHQFADKSTHYAYNDDGTVASIADANGHGPSFPTYDANGLPTKIVDAKDQTTQLSYSDDGLLLSVQDPNHASFSGGNPRDYRAFLDYDSFHRLGRQSSPKSTKLNPGNLIWSNAEYDANDNLVTQIAPHYGTQDGQNGPKTTTTYDAMDRPLLVTGPDKTDPAGEQTKFDYDGAGRLKQQTLPKGVRTTGDDQDFATFFDYDPLDRVIRSTRKGDGKALTTHYCYDLAHDLRTVTAPKANLASVDCAGPRPAFTTFFEYDNAHRLFRVTPPPADDAPSRSRQFIHDANDNLETSTDENGAVTTFKYDERDAPFMVIRPFDGDRKLTSKVEYDAVGNMKRRISPRAWDASSDKTTFNDYVTSIEYDAVDQPTKISLPTGGETEAAYVHRQYDANGNVTMMSLPTTKTDPATLNADDKTVVDYFDPGWIAKSNNPSDPPVHFDYRAEGWQTTRTPEKLSGGLDTDHQVVTSYFDDGLTQEEKARNGLVTTMSYDPNNNLVAAVASGATKDKTKPITIHVDYDGFDRPVKTRQREKNTSPWDATTMDYDENDNLVERVDNRVEDDSGNVTKPGRRVTFAYDQADWLTSFDDFGPKASSDDDRHLINHFWPTGWEEQRTVQKRNGAGVLETKQVTDWRYFENGKLKELTTKNRDGAVLETHTVSYFDNANADIYVNGHRTKDQFALRGPKTDAPCRDAGNRCTKTYDYDARDRLTKEVRSGGGGSTKEITYGLDAAGNVKDEVRPDGLKIHRDYQGNQLIRTEARKKPEGGQEFLPLIERYWYDEFGNLDCVTESGGMRKDCSPSEGAETPPNLVADYAYDGLNRLTGFRAWKYSGEFDTETSYVIDALDRPVEETERHGDPSKRTEFTYLGLSDDVAEEREFRGGQQERTKSYGYDAFGQRVSMTDTRPRDAGGTDYTKDYGYGYDVHGSVSLLVELGVDGAGEAKAQYGYNAYGDQDGDLSEERVPKDPDLAGEQANADKYEPLNPYRYTGKRIDTGTGTGAPDGADKAPQTNPQALENPQALDPGSGNLDMGARRFSPDTGRFLQEDQDDDALADLGLSADPLTANRYSLAAGNPVTYVEVDGHEPPSSFTSGCDPTYGRSCSGRTGTPSTRSRPDGGRDIPGPVRTRRAYVQQQARAQITRFIRREPAKAPGWLKTGLDIASYSPIGAPGAAIIARGVLAANEGDNTTALLSFAGAIPVPGGKAATAARLTRAGSAAKALPGARQVDAAWGVGRYKHGGVLSSIEHINYRHAYDSGFTNVSRYSKGTSVRQIKSYVDDALRYGHVSGDSATINYNLGRTIGTDAAGNALTGIRVHVRDGIIRTAYPVAP